MRGSPTLVPYWWATFQFIACVLRSSDPRRSQRLLAAALAEGITAAGGVVAARRADWRWRDSREVGCEAAVPADRGGGSRAGGGGRGGGGGRRVMGAGIGRDRERTACAVTTAST